MKIRSGFVSNSSSSSFIALAVPKSAWKPADIRSAKKEVQDNLSSRTIAQLATEYFKTDADFDKWKSGAACAEFWDWVYKTRVLSDDNLPDGFSSIERDDVEYIYRRTGPCVEYGTVEIDPDLIERDKKQISKLLPGVPVKMFLIHSE